jgi:hypothetical protein
MPVRDQHAPLLSNLGEQSLESIEARRLGHVRVESGLLRLVDIVLQLRDDAVAISAGYARSHHERNVAAGGWSRRPRFPGRATTGAMKVSCSGRCCRCHRR